MHETTDPRCLNVLRQKIVWAQGVLAKPNVTYPDGNWAHDRALKIRDDAEHELLRHLIDDIWLGTV